MSRWLGFYMRGCCGKCTPCREGTYWITGMLEELEHGHGSEERLQVIQHACSQIAGRSFCALGDAAATPYPAAMKFFREEFVTATTTPVDESFDPVAPYVFAGAAAR